VSGGGQDININITCVARKYFKHQRSSQCQISQMTQAVWHLQNVWTKMHTLIRKYFWYLSNVLFAKNKAHTGLCCFCQLWKLPSVEIKTRTPLLQWNIQTRSWFIYLCNHIVLTYFIYCALSQDFKISFTSSCWCYLLQACWKVNICKIFSTKNTRQRTRQKIINDLNFILSIVMW